MCLVLFFNCLAELPLFSRDEAGDGTGFCLALLHGSLGCHTCDPGGILTFQCKMLQAKTKKNTGHLNGSSVFDSRILHHKVQSAREEEC